MTHHISFARAKQHGLDEEACLTQAHMALEDGSIYDSIEFPAEDGRVFFTVEDDGITFWYRADMGNIDPPLLENV